MTLALTEALTPSSFISTNDKSRLKTVFDSSLKDDSVSYAILGLKLLGESVSNAGDLCKKLQSNIDSADVTSEKLFAATSAAKSSSFLSIPSPTI